MPEIEAGLSMSWMGFHPLILLIVLLLSLGLPSRTIPKEGWEVAVIVSALSQIFPIFWVNFSLFLLGHFPQAMQPLPLR